MMEKQDLYAIISISEIIATPREHQVGGKDSVPALVKSPVWSSSELHLRMLSIQILWDGNEPTRIVC